MEERNGDKRIGLESDLKELSKLIMKDRQTGKIKKEVLSSRVLGMLGYLSSDETSRLVPRRIDTVAELYTFTEEEMLHKFKAYKGKTWLKLNEILGKYNLPALNLPQEYISGS